MVLVYIALIILSIVFIIIFFKENTENTKVKELQKEFDKQEAIKSVNKVVQRYFRRVGIEGLIIDNYSFCDKTKISDVWSKYKSLKKVPILQFAKDLGFTRQGTTLMMLDKPVICFDKLVNKLDNLSAIHLRNRVYYHLSEVVARYLIHGDKLSGEKYINSYFLDSSNEVTLIMLVITRLRDRDWV